MKQTIEIAGWLGVALILGAYALNIAEVVPQNNLIYLMMNLVGASLTGWNLFVKKAYAVFFLEVVWVSVSLFGVIKVFA